MQLSARKQQKGKPRGRPFQPGQSGNPTGRPRVIGAMREFARSFTQDALECLAWEMYEGDTSAARIAAANLLLDRAWGKPTQPIAGDDSMDALRVTNGSRDAFLGRLDRLIAIAQATGVEERGGEVIPERVH